MAITERRPSGPRGLVGAQAEDAAAAHLTGLGWQILGRNLRLGRDELDIVALEPGRRATLVIVEVRSRSGPGFGDAVESVDARKVARLYRAALALRQGGHPQIDLDMVGLPSWRVDLLALARTRAGDWDVEQHLRGLAPP
jgi:putative endonuclease